ncbi:MAG TPA: hypothetical protein PLC89_23625 [Haliscomenobacter sp.]|uniref:hypothetical protein n=1 Tax=Haliscomenobacter sp. TaxID=2717303 RepID=UPI002BA8D2CE|nr:hypothetical protein [Haliscomenobacter sp.]HOY20323.1 hypothetical protein [Haliscomenobacter sp.]
MSDKIHTLGTPHERVRMLIRQVGLDQIELSKKLNISEPVVSSALKGRNEKSFQRIIDLLVREYSISLDDIYQQDHTAMQQIQERLDRIESGIEELKEMMRKLDQKR